MVPKEQVRIMEGITCVDQNSATEFSVLMVKFLSYRKRKFLSYRKHTLGEIKTESNILQINLDSFASNKNCHFFV